MKPARFDYLRPDAVEEAVAALAEFGEDALVIAGGQSLMAMLNLRVAAPSVLIDISRLGELSRIRERDGTVEIGAAVTQATVLGWPGLGDKLPLLSRAMPWVGHYQTRNRGTVCGSLVHADPSAELPLCLATLSGEVVLRSTRGERTVPAMDFQRGMLATAREPDELVVAARFPISGAENGYAFTEVARRHGDFAIVGLAAVSNREQRTLGVAGVADRPAVHKMPVAEDELDDALNDLAWELGGEDDIHASARQRRDLIRRLGPKVLREAAACCG